MSSRTEVAMRKNARLLAYLLTPAAAIVTVLAFGTLSPERAAIVFVAFLLIFTLLAISVRR
jgi:hypothetical protein